MVYTNRVNSNQGRNLRIPLILLQGIILALILSIVLIILFTAVIHLTGLSEVYSALFVFGASVVGIVGGARATGKKVGFKGWLYGGLVGLGYVLVVLVLGYTVLEGYTLEMNLFSKLFLGAVFGALGGIWGVNA